MSARTPTPIIFNNSSRATHLSSLEEVFRQLLIWTKLPNWMSGSERPHRINEVNRSLGPLTYKRDKEHLQDKKVAPQGAWSLLPILNEPFTLLYQLAVFKFLVYLRIPHATLYKPFQPDPFLSLSKTLLLRQSSFSSSVTKRAGLRRFSSPLCWHF